MSTEIGKYYNEHNKIITMPEVDYKPPKGGLGYLLYNSMKNNLDKVAQIDAATGKIEHYSSFLPRCIRTANSLIQRGIKPGDVVTVCSNNNMDCSVPFIATFLIGAVTSSLDPTLSLEETIHLLSMIEPKVIFASDNSETLIDKAIQKLNFKSEIVVLGKSSKFISFDDFIINQADNDNFKPHYENNLDQLATILFSSGSTGLPKGICFSHKFLLYTSRIADFDIYLGFATLYWATTTNLTIACALHGKGKLICRKFDPILVWDYIDKYEVTTMFIAPCDAIQLYRNKPKNHITNLKYFITVGASISIDYLEKLQEAMPKTKVIFNYGQTEFFWVFDNNYPIIQQKKNSVGLPARGTSYKIVNPDTEEILGFNEKGELRVKTQWIMNGYYKLNSSDNYDKDGYFKTGDVFYYDENFCFYIVDRIKEMFKYKSWHIVPAKIEGKLTSHKDVKYGVVIGIPHDEDDNHALAIVVPNDNHKSSPNDIKKHVEDRMDERHQLRAGVVFVESIPLTPTGKIKRRELKDMYVNGFLKIIK